MRIIANHKWKQGNLVKPSKILSLNYRFLYNYKSILIIIFCFFRPKKLDNPKFKEEEETLRKRFTEQVKQEENRFRQWEQHVSTSQNLFCFTIPSLSNYNFTFYPLQLIAERDRLNKDLEAEHSHIKSLEQELEQIQAGLSSKGGRK